MAMNQIGVTFMPSQEQAAFGPRQGAAEGDLQQAWKILSLRLPRVLGARAPAPSSLLTSPGSAGMMGNPNASVMRALVEAYMGGQQAPPMGDPGQFTPPKPRTEFLPNPVPGGDVDTRRQMFGESRRSPFGRAPYRF